MKKAFSIIILLVFFGGVVIYTSSCKQPKAPKAVVFVVDETNQPVEGARVVVKPQKTESGRPAVVYLESGDKAIADTQYTNDEGKVNYDFRYRAIYKVEVYKAVDKNYPLARRGLGILMLEEDKTIESKIRINEQTTF